MVARLLPVFTLLFWGASLSVLAPHLFGAYFWAALAPAGVGLVLMTVLMLKRCLSGGTQRAKRFEAMLATSLLFSVAIALVDLTLTDGAMLLRGLALLRLDIFLNARAELTLAWAGGILHPALFTALSMLALCLERRRA